MKKIFNILLLAVFTLSVFTACEKDDDSNPVLKEPTTFSLNLPPYAANNIYDLKNAKTVFFENADNAAEFVRRGVIPARPVLR